MKRIKVAWYALLGRPVIYNVEICGGVRIESPTLVVGCTISDRATIDA